jgi:hypothetical protein
LNPEVLILIERKLGVRIVNLKFERVGFGWVSLVSLLRV